MESKKHSLIYSFFSKVLAGILAIFGLYWLLVSVQGLSRVMSLPYVAMFSLLTFVIFKFPSFFWKFLSFLNKNKIYIFILMIIFQILIVISSKMMIRSDAAMLFNSAIGEVDKFQTSYYLSLYPNNLPWFLYEKISFNIFGSATVWVLQGLNMIYLDSAIVILTYTMKRFYTQKAADIAFFLFTFILGFTPQFLAMYTDIATVPITSALIFFGLRYIKESKKREDIFIMAVITTVGYIIRPTLVIPFIAFTIVILFINLVKFNKNSKKVIFSSIISIIIFGCLAFSFNAIVKSQKEVKIVPNQSASLLWFVDLGLTYSGTDQMDLRQGLSEFGNEFKLPITDKKVIKADIKRRLNDYTVTRFTRHILEKTKGTISDGTLGWVYEEPNHEGYVYTNPLSKKLDNNNFFNYFSSTFIYKNQIGYTKYIVFLQTVFILIIVGFIRFTLYRKKTDLSMDFICLAIFGGMLFLTIFEGGKARYILQLMPQIIFISSIGLAELEKYFKPKLLN